MTPYKDKVTAAQATATLQENVVPAFNFGLASSNGLEGVPVQTTAAGKSSDVSVVRTAAL